MRPLEGIRVVDLTQYQQGPMATVMLADMGAEVIKVEVRGTGDPGRELGPRFPKGLTAYHEAHNRGKKSITLDVRKEKGKEILYKLVATADIFAQNFRVGVAQRLGFDYATLAQINPRLIYLTGSGFGLRGPLRDRPGFDAVGQAMGGIMSMTGGPGAPDLPIGAPLADQTGAFLLANGALLALFHRERTGEGQEVDVSLLGSVIALVGWRMQEHLATGRIPPKQKGRVSPGIFAGSLKDSNGRYFIFQAVGPKAPEAIFRILKVEHLLADPRFASYERMQEHVEALFDILNEVSATKGRDEWMERFKEADIVTAPVYNLLEAATQPQAIANEYIVEVNHPLEGPIRAVGIPIKLHKTPGKVGTSPSLGQHTEEVLKGLGYGGGEIAELRRQEVI